MRPVLFVFSEGWPLVGGVPVMTYGAMLAAALLVAWVYIRAVAARAQIASWRVVVALSICLVSGLLGARVMALWVQRPEGQPVAWGELLALDHGGLMLPGLFLGILVSAALVVPRMIDLDLWDVLDRVTPGIALAAAVQRLGCWGVGCCFGRQTSSWFGVHFPRWTQAQIPWAGEPCGPSKACGPHTSCDPVAAVCQPDAPAALALHQELGEVGADAALSASVVPSQLVLLAFFALLAGLLWVIRARFYRFHGQIFVAFLGIFGFCRFFLELMREDRQRGALWATTSDLWFLTLSRVQTAEGVVATRVLTVSQVASVVILAVAVVLGVWLARRPLGDVGEEDRGEPAPGR